MYTEPMMSWFIICLQFIIHKKSPAGGGLSRKVGVLPRGWLLHISLIVNIVPFHGFDKHIFCWLVRFQNSTMFTIRLVRRPLEVG